MGTAAGDIAAAGDIVAAGDMRERTSPAHRLAWHARQSQFPAGKKSGKSALVCINTCD